MSKALIANDDITLSETRSIGPAMRALNDRQRAFVRALLETGSSNASLCARMAGYTGNEDVIKVTAHRLAHNEKVQAAIREEAGRRLNSGAIMAASRLVQIAETAIDQKTALRAIEMLLNRTGLHATSEHKVSVENIGPDDQAGQIARVVSLANSLGLDPVALLGSRGISLPPDAEKAPVIEGEFEEAEVEPATSFDGLEDLL